MDDEFVSIRTRRMLLQRVASIFDPLGLVCPVTITGKILLQDAWRLSGGWDDELPEELSIRADKWLRER